MKARAQALAEACFVAHLGFVNDATGTHFINAVVVNGLKLDGDCLVRDRDPGSIGHNHLNR